jgi:hypothetical protein
MATEIAEKLLSQFYKDGQVVYDHVSDPTYSKLGLTQMVSMLFAVSSLLTLMIPTNENQPIYQAYEALDKLVSNEYGHNTLGLNILNYGVWAFSSVMLGSFIGRKIGSGIWALYCLISTQCKSHHTMDLALSKTHKNKVTKNLIFTAFESGRESYGELLNEQQKDELAAWIQTVNIFFTNKRKRDLKRGKVQSAEAWWIVKKNFYQDLNPQTLIDKLVDYTDKLQANIDKTQAYYDTLTTRIIPSAQTQKQCYHLDENHYVKLLLNLINDYDSSIGIRHQRRSSQSIYKNKKSLNSIFDHLEKNKHTQEELLNSMKSTSNVLEKVLSRLHDNLNATPKTPEWLNNILSHNLSQRYAIQCRHQLDTYLNDIMRYQKRLAPYARKSFIENTKNETIKYAEQLQAEEVIIDIRESNSSNDSDEYSTARSIMNMPLIN